MINKMLAQKNHFEGPEVTTLDRRGFYNYEGDDSMNKDLIRQARRASVVDYLKSKAEILVREGKQYRVKKHTGLVASGNKWYSHTLLKGGNALDYLVEMEGMDFKKAVAELTQRGMCTIHYDKTSSNKTISIPKRNENDKRIMAYLVKTRGIKAEIIIPLLKQGRIYEAAGTHNLTMTGVDEDGNVRYVMQRSTLHTSNLKFESEGSNKKYSFNLRGQSGILCTFESPLDLLSYMVIQTEAMKAKSHMLSLGGVTDIAIDAYLARIPGIRKIVFGLDNDKAGHDAYESFFKKYSMKGFKVYKHFPTQKDWNLELLCMISSKQ